jgi:RNase adaptor protein for sRNA GlmZ degradation
MKHIIMGVPRDGDFAVFNRELPNSIFEDLGKIMNWKDENDHLYDFQLTDEQIKKIENIISEKLPNDDLDLFLTCSE